MPQSFTEKTIRVEIILGQGDFAEGGNTVAIEGLPVSVGVEKPGLPELNSANVSIYGLSMDKLRQLTQLNFLPFESQKNLISIQAGDLGAELSTVFQGEISMAWADFNSTPSVELVIEALSGFYPQRVAAPPLSVNGSAMAAELISQQAAQIGYSFINQDILTQVRSAVFNGSPLEKCREIARQIGAQLIIDDKTIVLKAATEARTGGVPLLSAESSLLGYPTFTQDGIAVECLYRPDIEYGGLIKVESIVPRATGTWQVTKLSHALSAYTSGGGTWKTSIEGKHVG